VTIAIVTRDRRDELRSALRSALEQEGSIEVLVVDDGSRDGTSEMVRDDFSGVRVVRFEEPAGIAVRRNDATAAARGDVILSIDDDAVFSSPNIVRSTLADFDHPRIGAVAIPYIDVGVSEKLHQRAPDEEDRWVTSVFRATAYAIRRELLVELGGFHGEIFHQGEEWDLSLRMLDAGYLIRLGRADPIHHRASPHRSVRKMDVYGRRNELLICWSYFPFPWSFVYMVGYAASGLVSGFRLGRPWNMTTGIAAGVRSCVRARRRRRPISRAAFRFDQRARSSVRGGSGVRLAHAELELGLSSRRDEQPPAASPARPLPFHAQLRDARSRIVRAVGRPVRCEACGEVLFYGLPLLWRGRLKLLGAESALVRADWDKMNRMTFRHVESDRCATQ